MVTPILPLGVRDASARMKGKTLIGPLDLDVSGDGITIVMGPNGSGKTTLLRLLHGLQRLSGGSISWATDIDDARKKQAFVFQTPVLLRRSAVDNLAYPLLLAGMSKSKARIQAEAWLEKIGLEHIANLNARQISGGEKQKLAISRALICDPQLLFLDEPTSNLDGQSTREIETLLRDAASKNVKIIMATHETGQARRLADEVWFLYRGKIHEKANAKSFFNKPETAQAKAFLEGDIVE